MANQINLDLLWADLGGRTDPTDTKWEAGWIAEIPTYQNFNYVIHATESNVLHLAENGAFQWQTEINYKVGSAVREDGFEWYCITDHSGQQPSLDATNSYWVNGKIVGRTPATPYTQKHGLYIADVNDRTLTTWGGNDVTIENTTALVAMNSTSTSVDNLVFGNVGGELVVVDVGNSVVPDNRSIALSESYVSKIFHEANPPTQSQVAGTIPDAPSNNTLYARKGGNWIKASSTDVQTQPPPAVQGAGGGWFNLDDGQLYLDIDDGDSSQWVPANPPVIPDPPPVSITEVYRTGIAGQADYDIGLTAINASAINIVVDGTPQAVNTYSVVGEVVTFSGDLPEVGSQISFRVIESISINTPAASTVTRASIQQPVWDIVTKGRKNLIMNGNFSRWDYGTSQTLGGYGSNNRFRNDNVNSTKLHTQEVFALGQTEVDNNPEYYSRTVVTSVAGADSFVSIEHHIESVQKCAGKTVTLTINAKADAAKNVAVEFVQFFGTGGGSATVTSIGSQLVAITTAWNLYTITVDIPSVAGKTIGNDNNDFLSLRIWMDAGADSNARAASIGQQSGTFDFANIQLESGSEATPFEYQTQGEILADCQRYFERIKGGSTETPISTGLTESTTELTAPIRYSSAKRAACTLSYGGSFIIRKGDTNIPASYFTFFDVGLFSCNIKVARTDGATHEEDKPAILTLAIGSSNYIDIDAEL
jgi:hypothetical protein